MAKETSKTSWWSYIDNIESQEGLNSLAIAFRKLCFEMGILTPLQYEEMLQRYVDRTIVDPKMRSGTKGNLKKAMHSPTMTMNTFNECMLMLDVDSINFKVCITKDNDTIEVEDARQLRRSRTRAAVLRRRINPKDKDQE